MLPLPSRALRNDMNEVLTPLWFEVLQYHSSEGRIDTGTKALMKRLCPIRMLRRCISDKLMTVSGIVNDSFGEQTPVCPDTARCFSAQYRTTEISREAGVAGLPNRTCYRPGTKRRVGG